MEDGSPEVQGLLEAEQRHAQHWLRRVAPLAAELRQEMLAAAPPPHPSPPERVGPHEYFVLHGASGHPCYMRRHAGPTTGAGRAEPRTAAAAAARAGTTTAAALSSAAAAAAAGAEVVLDVGELAAVHGEYVQVGQMKLSQCGRHLAFTLDAGTGEEALQAFTRDLSTGALRHLSALGGVSSLEWAAGGRGLLAAQPNELGRPWRVVAVDAAADGSGSSGGAGHARWGSSGGAVLWEEPDERFFVELGRTKDWGYLTINANSKSCSEVALLRADLGAAPPSGPGGGSVPGLAALAPRVVQPRQAGLEYFLEHNGGQLYLLSNARGAGGYALFRVPAAAPSLHAEHWRVVLPERPGVALEDMDMSRHWLVVYQRVQGRQAVAALPLRDGLPAAGTPATSAAVPGAQALPAAAAQRQHAAAAGGAAAAELPLAAATVPQGAAGTPEPEHDGGAAALLHVAPLPSWALSVVAGANADFESSTLRLMLSSPVHPEAAFDWQLGSQALEPRSGWPAGAAAASGQQPRGRAGAGAGADAAAAAAAAADAAAGGLAWRQLWATSADGTAVPLTVAHAGSPRSAASGLPQGSPLPGSPRPCLLVVYGAYGHCLPTEFLPERVPLLRRGWVLALAHVRGGGELGRRWHAAGRGAAKHNSLADLQACLEALCAAGLTRPGLVALEAHSAGGLAAGALLNARGGELGAALLEAPFVDVLSAMARPELPLTVHEYEEWGDPAQGAAFDQVRRLCPYQGVRPGARYPPTLLTCSQTDLRVPYWGPLKYAARLRAAMGAAAGTGTGAAHASSAGARQEGQGQRRGGPILLLPDAQAGHFVHERDLAEAKAQQYAFLVAAVEGRL